MKNWEEFWKSLDPIEIVRALHTAPTNIVGPWEYLDKHYLRRMSADNKHIAATASDSYGAVHWSASAGSSISGRAKTIQEAMLKADDALVKAGKILV